MKKNPNVEELRDQYRHRNFYPSQKIELVKWDDKARVITLSRRSKKHFAVDVIRNLKAGMTGERKEYEILDAEMPGYILSLKCGE